MQSRFFLLFLALFAAACGTLQPKFHADAPDDGAKIQASGKLRILIWPEAEGGGNVSWAERQRARDLAIFLGLEPQFEHVKSFEQALASLASGSGDLIAARNLGPSDGGAWSTLPYLVLDEWLLTRKDAVKKPWKQLGDLGDGLLCLREPSPQAQLLPQLLAQHPGLKTKSLIPSFKDEDLLKKLAQGECDALLVDSLQWRSLKGQWPQVVPAWLVKSNAPAAFAMRPNSKSLHLKVNNFLFAQALGGLGAPPHQDDLPEIKQRGTLRMLTRNNNMTFFLQQGNQVGFEFDMMQRFAKSQGLELEVVTPAFHSDLLPWLNQGKGDVVAASLNVNPLRAKQAAFTKPYYQVEEWLVTGSQGNMKLEGAVVSLRRSSAMAENLPQLKEQFPGVTWRYLPEDLEDEDILAQVAQGEIAYAVADSSQVEAMRRAGLGLKIVRKLGDAHQAWAVRASNPLLLKELNKFVELESRSGVFKVHREKYFHSAKNLKASQGEYRSDLYGRISPYDDLAKSNSYRFKLDWKLITAQMYQESRFDPKKISPAGARGLLQVLPSTAKSLGQADASRLLQPGPGLEVGVAYMTKLFANFDDVEQLKDRIQFTLAAYNAGIGHLADARALARRLGLNDEVWAGNVETAIRLLERPEYYQTVRYGRCRGWEPVQYVTEITRRYLVYVQHVPLTES